MTSPQLQGFIRNYPVGKRDSQLAHYWVVLPDGRLFTEWVAVSQEIQTIKLPACLVSSGVQWHDLRKEAAYYREAFR